jgi:hypothetical protein
MRMWDKGIWGFGGMGVLVGLRRERDGSVGVEGNVGGTKGHEEGDRGCSVSRFSGIGMRR